MTWTSTIRPDSLVELKGTWVRLGAVEAVVPYPNATRIWLRSGEWVMVTMTVEEVMDAFAKAMKP